MRARSSTGRPGTGGPWLARVVLARVEQVRAEDPVGRAVDEVPVVDPPGSHGVEVERGDARTLGVVASAHPARSVEARHEDEQCAEPVLVQGARQQLGDAVEVEAARMLHDLPRLRHGHAEEVSPSPYSPGAVLKKRADAAARAGSATAASAARTAAAVASVISGMSAG